MDFIDRLRTKSPAAKKGIAFVTSGVVTLAIFGMWVSVLRFNNNQNPSNVTAAVANSSDVDTNPFSAFWQVISEGWGGLADNINQVKTDLNQAKDLISNIDTASSVNFVVATSSEPVPTINTLPAPKNDVFILSGDDVDGSGITQ